MPKPTASGRKAIMRIEEDTGTDNGQGGHTPTWTTVPGLEYVPMEFATASGGKSIIGLGTMQHYNIMQLYPKVNVQLKMRYRASVAVVSGMRAVYGNHIYQIRGAENVGERNETIMLYCEELLATGSVR